MDEPLYRVWITGEHRPRPFTLPDQVGRWAAEEAWPSPRIEARRLHLNDRRLGAAALPVGPLCVRSPATAGRDCGRWGGYGGSCPDLPIDQRREDGLALAFDTPPLDEELTLLGAPALDLTVTVDEPHVNLCARLCDVYPDGTSALMTYGVLNLSHRDGHEHPEPCPVGTPFRVHLALNDFARTVPKGHRIRLAIANQHWPILWPQPRLSTLAVATGDSTLVLPVRPPSPRDRDVRFAEARTAPPVPSTVLVEAFDRRVATEDVGAGEETIALLSDHGRLRYDDRGDHRRLVQRRYLLDPPRRPAFGSPRHRISLGDPERRGRHGEPRPHRADRRRDAFHLELAAGGPRTRQARPQRRGDTANQARFRLREAPETMLTYAVKRIGLGLLILVFVMVVMYAAVFLVPGDPATRGARAARHAGAQAAADRAHGPRPARLVADRRVLPQRADRQSRLRRLVEPSRLDAGHGRSAQHADPRCGRTRHGAADRRSAWLPVGHAARHAGRRLDRRAVGRRDRRAVLRRRHLCLLVFAVWLRWLPAIGAGEPGDIASQARALVLPALAIALGWIGYISRMVRASMMEVMSEPHIRTARAFGLPEWKIVSKYALRIAIIPTISLVAVGLGSILSSAVFVEAVFARPGIGKLITDAVNTRNYPVVMGTVLIMTAIYVFITIAADLLIARLDPRVRDVFRG